MRLLLDEMYSPRIAEQLRRQGHDVISASERGDLTGASDAELVAAMTVERRAVVTNNASDFVGLVNRALAVGEEHPGLVLTSDRSLPRTLGGIGAIVRALGGLLHEHPGDAALRNEVRWLP